MHVIMEYYIYLHVMLEYYIYLPRYHSMEGSSIVALLLISRDWQLKESSRRHSNFLTELHIGVYMVNIVQIHAVGASCCIRYDSDTSNCVLKLQLLTLGAN